jgi:arylsulfatase A-like enzyme
VPALVRWPGHIQPGSVSVEMFSGFDWFPTLMAAAGDSTIKDRLHKGTAIGGTTFKVHLDGYNQLPYLTGQQGKSARTEFAYYDDDGILVAFRHENWKEVFCEMEKPGGFAVWCTPFTCLRIPKIFNLRMDPYERADIVSDQYDDWRIKNAYLMGWVTFLAANFIETFVQYPRAKLLQASRSTRWKKNWRARSRPWLNLRRPREPIGRPYSARAPMPDFRWLVQVAIGEAAAMNQTST